MRSKNVLSFSAFCNRTLGVLLLLVLFPIQAAEAQSPSNFATVQLPRGIELQIPKGWWLIGADFNQAIQTSSEAAIELSGIGLPDGVTTNLIAANSMPLSTYAAVRVDSVIPTTFLPTEFASITTDDVQALQTEIRQNLQKLLPIQGIQLLVFFHSRIESISGYPAIVTEYRRTGPKGPVFVQLIQIFTESQEIHVNLSYRESEAGLWMPVINKIRRSIVVRH